ncbi:DNA-binding transcriptional MerR regulator [Kitasatospora gansuensis]|uniref:DNA-binding transcriptional MerR regulator n=1 Tax=Kitasatospora gansuensis TaxID=258050 RepID=A0A7W7SEQ6_9ACTN|nr:MerR family transcriptional regulator [Kitasatospora gansuensis]MBB4947996.1 DNA-binding transcriptional MerR regulator [Kitasatospora gansuensis]
MRSIGEMARHSGLSVSALRFYDGAGVFGPAWVDPQSGYRWYAEEQLRDARLIARLRRVGMPLPDISRVLSADPAVARQTLDTHLRRLEDGLSDARRELSTVRALLDQREHPMNQTRLTTPAHELAAALDAVRFAVGSNPEQPALCGVLLELASDGLRLVATDRYRLAVSLAPATALDGPPVSAIAATAFVDEVRALLDGAEDALLTVDGDLLTLTVTGDEREVTGRRVGQDYPDYRPMLRLEPTRRLAVDAAELRAELSAGATRSLTRSQDGVEQQVSVLTVGTDGALGVADEEGAAGEALRIGVNREFLLEAITAGRRDQLTLELGGPVAPLAIRYPDREGTFSLLMPTVLS